MIKNSLYSIAAEMKVVLAKTAYSPILKVAGDYSCGVFDASGQTVAQGAGRATGRTAGQRAEARGSVGQ